MSRDPHRPPIRVAIMGVGRSVFTDHLPIFKANPELFKIVAVCDLIKEHRDMIEPELPDCRMYRQYQDMLLEHDIDLVLVSSCSVDHVDHAMASLERGFWTLVETPLSLTFEDVQVLRGAAAKAKNRLLAFHRGVFEPDYLLAQQVMDEARLGEGPLGELYEVRLRKEDFIRRDDWQTVKRLGGGAAYYAVTDMMIQAVKLLDTPPIQMWSELKRIASLGDAEDYVHVCLKTRAQISADVEFNGGVVAENRQPSFAIRGSRGQFTVMPGQTEGVMTVIDPRHKFPRRRSSVRTPPVEDMHEEVEVIRIPVSLAVGKSYGLEALWKQIYATVRTAAPYPVSMEEAIDAVKFAQLMKKTSPFGK